MNKKIQLAIWSALVTFVLIAIPSFIHYAPQLVGKTFTEQRDFEYRIEQTYENLAVSVLNPIDLEKAMKTIRVSQEEIEEYRGRYGSLTDQLSSIQRQYTDRITEAKEQKNEMILLALVKERNAKMKDIEKNFTSDDYVADKIRSDKARELANTIKENENNRQDQLPISYDLVNTETGERLTKGTVDIPSIFREEFNDEKGYFKANSAMHHMGYSEYMDAHNMAYSTDEEAIISNPPQYFEGTISIPEETVQSGALKNEHENFKRGKYMLYVFWIVGIAALIALLTKVKFRSEWVAHTKFTSNYVRWKIDVKVALLLLTAVSLAIYIESITFNIFNQLTYLTLGTVSKMIVSFLLIGVLFTILLAFQAVHLFEQYRQPGTIEKALKESYTAQFMQNIVGMFSNRTIGIQLFYLLIGFFLAGLGLAVIVVGGFGVLLYVACVVFLGLPALYLFASKGAYLNRILAATNDMAAGHLTQAIPVKGKSPLAKHAANLNNLREGVRVSINEQAKSERLKSELITNVSHDLRTPLTSIITYTDLLKNENLSAEERSKYVAILDQKSQRLKTLIEDLFEVSKMASGNMELVRQRVDLNQLMQQALAEHAEEFSKQDLSIRSTLSETPVYAMVDGQKWWRVLDNLLINTLKYSLIGTRVYVNLQKIGSNARITIKNVAKYEIGDNTDELFERFKRGDESRQTEGSGLGLAIAQSIVELHGGKMGVEVDGDLFKVTIDIIAG
ncbi:MFS domain-containing histidine kinase [Sporosarcina sp. GW1-11]|uniref:sensor histidine kinase n=1 Tax=Sporosarcina sp. GW1-11 TaxID=2899126 RepID=UPI00294F9BBC|nr:MFS domain-containing histidine kinase [Sporosarcina sp. GW1-11]MDV6379104.1 MFS domain-containing histidine kinase [Sporosarcina sp. GW1-11]